jgi:Flp pilus assembly protein TadG
MRMSKLHPRKERRRGSAIVEAALMTPWIFFLFVGVLDLGFYCYEGVCTQNAARAAALATSASSSLSAATACTAALGELNSLPNVAKLTTCNAAPLTVTVTQLSNTTNPPCADCNVTPTATSSLATVVYVSPPMVPIPGMLAGQMTITRTAEMRISQ